MFACWLAAAAVLVAAVGADADTARRSGTTAAAAPFAAAWAKVPSSPAARRARNVVVFGAHGQISGFNPVLSCCNTLQAGFAGVNEGLRGAFNEDNRGAWFKDIVSAASADRTGLSYTIKANASWYWGGRKVPVTYRDFVYTLQEIDDPNTDALNRAGYSQLDPTHFTHRGLKQVKFFWKTSSCSIDSPCGPYANWRALFANLYPSFALKGLDFNKIWTGCICGSDGKPVSDGPFYLSNYTKGQGATLKANPYYYDKPKLSEVDVRFFAEGTAEEEAMRGGQVDAIAPAFGQILLPLKSAPGITFDQVPGYYLDHLELREGKASAGSSVTKGSSNLLLRAPWLREAIMLGLDRQRIIDTVYGRLAGNLKPLDNLIFYSTQTHYRRDFRRWNYDPAKALALLKRHCAAGSGPAAPSPANTEIWQCAGLSATFNWTWNLSNDVWAASEQMAKAELKSIGIQIDEKPLASDVIFGPNGIVSGDYDIVEFASVSGGDPADFYDVYHCRGEQNYTGYCSHAVDALLQAASGELDPAKRASLFQRADAIMATQVPMVPMWQRPVPLIHRSDLLGLLPNPSGAALWNIEDWHWRT
jgi:peptide/nickel transport system substrate-binding protein